MREPEYVQSAWALFVSTKGNMSNKNTHPLSLYMAETAKAIIHPMDRDILINTIESRAQTAEWFGETFSPALMELTVKALRKPAR